MNNEEAIEVIKSNYPSERYTMLREALDLAVELMELQIPKSPIIKSWNPAFCPNCKSELSEDLGDGYYKHYYIKEICECGQKLNWEELRYE